MNRTSRTRIMKIAICLASTALILVVIALLCLKVYDEVKVYWVFIRLLELSEPSVIEPSNYSWYVSAAEEERYDITWTGDATTIVFSNRGGSGSRHLTNIYVVDANGTQLTRWIPEGAPQDAKGELAYDSTPYVNPVTSQIVYATLRHGVYRVHEYRGLQIATAELDGSGYRRLTESDSRDLNPAWSPDGTRIAFVSDRSDRYFRVYIMDADGSNVVEAASVGTIWPERPLWSPDGVHLAFRRDGHLYTAPAVGGGARGTGPATTLYGPIRTDPAWSPDGEWLAFSDHESSGKAIEYETISMVRPGFTAGPVWAGIKGGDSLGPSGRRVDATGQPFLDPGREGPAVHCIPGRQCIRIRALPGVYGRLGPHGDCEGGEGIKHSLVSGREQSRSCPRPHRKQQGWPGVHHGAGRVGQANDSC